VAYWQSSLLTSEPDILQSASSVFQMAWLLRADRARGASLTVCMFADIDAFSRA